MPDGNPSDWYTGIWGSGENDIFVLGYVYEQDIYDLQGVLLHFDGKSWTRKAVGIEWPLYKAWGDQSGAVYLVGAAGTILKGTL